MQIGTSDRVATDSPVDPGAASPGVISFRAYGVPKGQPRPRAFAFKGKARVFDPGTAEHWKSAVAIAARPHLPAEPLVGALRVMLTFWMPRPKSHYKRDELRPDAPVLFTGKPDADNLAKAVLDALTSLGMWKDDSQVAELGVFKWYETRSQRPGCLIRVEL